MKGWPPSQLEDGTIKQDSTLACSVAVISTDTAGREKSSRPSKVDPGLSTSPSQNQNSFLVFLRLPTYIIAEISAHRGTVVFESASNFIDSSPTRARDFWQKRKAF